MTYIKLGQYLALRLDIMTPPAAEELSRLFEQVKPMPPQDVRAVIERALNRPIADCFQSFCDTPLGSASIAQVHRAVTHDGHAVAVKVRRLGIDRLFAADIRNLRRVAALFDALSATTTPLQQVVEEFAIFTGRELDLSEEARTVEIIAASRPPRVTIPRVYRDLSAEQVLTTDLIDGISFDRVCQLHEEGRSDELASLLHGADLRRAFADVIAAVMYLTFETGRFHGDPHPGNLILRPDGSVALVDFGIYGELALDQRRTFGHYLRAVALGRPEEAARVHDRLCFPTRRTDVRRFHADFAEALRQWFAATTSAAPKAVTRRALGGVYGALLDAMRRNAVRTRPEQILLWRSLALLDLTSARWPIAVDTAGEMAAYFRRHPPRPARAIERLLTTAADADAVGAAVSAALGADRSQPRTLRVRRAGDAEPRGEGVVAMAALAVAMAVVSQAYGSALLFAVGWLLAAGCVVREMRRVRFAPPRGAAATQEGHGQR